MFVRKGNQHGTYGMERPHQTRLQGRISAPPRRDLAGDGQGFERGRHLQLQHFLLQAESPIVDRWNEYMKDILELEMDPVTGAQPKLDQVFWLD